MGDIFHGKLNKFIVNVSLNYFFIYIPIYCIFGIFASTLVAAKFTEQTRLEETNYDTILIVPISELYRYCGYFLYSVHFLLLPSDYKRRSLAKIVQRPYYCEIQKANLGLSTLKGKTKYCSENIAIIYFWIQKQEAYHPKQT